MRDAFASKLMQLGESDPRIFLVTGDLGFGVFEKFDKKCPSQFLNVGVAEQNMTGVAVGLALEGRIVFNYSIANFSTLRCLEQIRNDICHHRVNVNVVSMGGGFSYGSLGISHHATEDLGVMRTLPNMTIVAPGDLWEVQQATQAIVNVDGPCYFRIDKTNAGFTQRPNEVFEIGKARRLVEGNELTLVCIGGILSVVLRAAEKLREVGLQCRVVSMHTLKPLDQIEIFDAVKNTGGILTVEEHTVEGGLGGAVAETCLDHGIIPRCFKRIGLREGFSSIAGTQEYLRQQFGMDEASIVSAAQKLLIKNSKKSDADSLKDEKVI